MFVLGVVVGALVAILAILLLVVLGNESSFEGYD